MIGAMMSIPPAVEYGTASGKHVMRAPAFEHQRIFNRKHLQPGLTSARMGITARIPGKFVNTKGINPKNPGGLKISGAVESEKFKITN